MNCTKATGLSSSDSPIRVVAGTARRTSDTYPVDRGRREVAPDAHSGEA
jgi:hypothetical protein